MTFAVSVGILHASFAEAIQNLKRYVHCYMFGRDQNMVHRASMMTNEALSFRNASKLVHTIMASPASTVSSQKDIVQNHSDHNRAHTEFHSATTLFISLRSRTLQQQFAEAMQSSPQI